MHWLSNGSRIEKETLLRLCSNFLFFHLRRFPETLYIVGPSIGSHRAREEKVNPDPGGAATPYA